jgi:hypothetical protein
MAKGGAFEIEGNGDKLGFPVTEELDQHHGKSVDGIGRKSLGIGKVPDGIKGTIDIIASINQE